MEVSQKKPAAGAPAAKEPAPTLASGKYTFSKAEALRRYVLRKQNKSGKGVSVAKRAEVNLTRKIKLAHGLPFLIIAEKTQGPVCWETIQQGYPCCQPEEEAQQLPC